MKRIVLVACSAGKVESGPVPARDLYNSQLFKLARAYAEKRTNCEALGDRWFILSALHGLLDPDELVAPYDASLNDESAAERRHWAYSVMAQIELLQLGQCEIVILAGRAYREHLQSMLAAQGHVISVPMDGMGIGQQLQFLSNDKNYRGRN